MDDRVTRIKASEASLLAMLRKIAEEGREYLIADHGEPVARVTRERKKSERNMDDMISEWEALQNRCTLGGVSWKELRDEGRK